MHPIEQLIAVIAPNICIGCGSEGDVFCAECSDTISQLPAICYACGKATINYKLCPACLSKYKPQHVWIYAAYDGLAKDLVHVYKFEAKRQAAKRIAVMLDGVLPYFAEAPIVTFVPTAPLRRRERGFDQAELLAKELARLRNWHVAGSLVRQKQVRQLGANREQRKAQLKGVFRVINKKLVANKHILLVDDVVTTGATLEACSKELKKAGASLVDATVFARTPMC